MNFKKALNILSYSLNVIFIAILIFAFWGNNEGKSTNNENRIASIKECILEREKADIPLKIQQFERVYGITISDIVLTNNIEPYSGYLITSWDLDEKQELSAQQWAANGYKDKYIRKQKEVYVEVSNITISKKGEVSWKDNWSSAYFSVKDNK